MLQKHLIRRLDLITLQLFVSVHQEGTLTRAAELEMIALSAASKRMNDMEQALGIELFERNAKGMELTAAGETLLYYAKRILTDVEKISIDVGEHLHGYVAMFVCSPISPPSSSSCRRTYRRSLPITGK